MQKRFADAFGISEADLLLPPPEDQPLPSFAPPDATTDDARLNLLLADYRDRLNIMAKNIDNLEIFLKQRMTKREVKDSAQDSEIVKLRARMELMEGALISCLAENTFKPLGRLRRTG